MLTPSQPIFLDAMQRNLGKPSPDDMELVSLPPDGARPVFFFFVTFKPRVIQKSMRLTYEPRHPPTPTRACGDLLALDSYALGRGRRTRWGWA